MFRRQGYTTGYPGKQNYSSGVAYTKTLTVDGDVPYKEARNLNFRYSPDWQLVSPQTEAGETCLLYLTKGTHTLRLTNTLGDLGSLLRQVETSSQVLSDLYRRVRMVVGHHGRYQSGLSAGGVHSGYSFGYRGTIRRIFALCRRNAAVGGKQGRTDRYPAAGNDAAEILSGQ